MVKPAKKRKKSKKVKNNGTAKTKLRRALNKKKASWLSRSIGKISKLDRYVRPEKVENAFKLDSNENFALDREFISNVTSSTASNLDLREYPINEFDIIYRRLASYTGIDEKNIAVGNGSDQIIELLLSTIGKGRRATVFTPTFSYFMNRCELHNITIDQVPLNRDLTLDKTAFTKSAKKSEIVYICSPNNPTGNQFDRQTVIEVIESLDSKLILIDEAYADFADYSLMDYAIQNANNIVVVLRTLSKAFGLAGARVGYMVSNENFVQIFRSVIQSPYPISTISLAIASNILSKSDYIKKTIEAIRQERTRVLDLLNKIKPIKAFKSDANFIFFEAGSKYEQILQTLKNENLIVKALGNIAGHRGCIRVTIGTREINEKFLECIERAAR